MTRDSKKKLRRWSFAIECEGKGFNIPVVGYGSQAKANQITKQIEKDYAALDQLKGKKFTVMAIPHETISHTTQQQFDGMEFELKLVSRAMNLLREDVDTDDPTGSMSDKEWNGFIGLKIIEAKEQLLKEYYPEGSNTLSESLNREKKAVEEDDFKMALGLQAYKEVLNGANETSK